MPGFKPKLGAAAGGTTQGAFSKTVVTNGRAVSAAFGQEQKGKILGTGLVTAPAPVPKKVVAPVAVAEPKPKPAVAPVTEEKPVAKPEVIESEIPALVVENIAPPKKAAAATAAAGAGAGSVAAPTRAEKAAATPFLAAGRAALGKEETYSYIAPPPAERTPFMTREGLIADTALKSALVPSPFGDMLPKRPTPKEAARFTPILSARFQDFMIQSYMPYSPDLVLAQKLGKKPTGPKEIDQDACKKRNPDQVELFYYQKIVRDYLQRDSPYRGLLVYHGLGSGKTCTSIAAAEALYWGGQKKIYVLTPATLSNNYRKDLGKCGYYPLRQKNFWQFLPLGEKKSELVRFWLVEQMGLPAALVERQGGGWVPTPPTPARPSNFADLDDSVKTAIRAQIDAHMNHRFEFIHYNGVDPMKLAKKAVDAAAAGGSYFDNAVVVIDEIHNLVRTINGTQIGSRPFTEFMERVEPRAHNWNMERRKAEGSSGFRYPRGYTLYRLLCNAVGAKIIALSATPMINYAQEYAILMNIIGGDQRMAELSLKNMSREPAVLKRLEEWAKKRPDIDFYSVEESAAETVLTVTPVPHGFAKVINEADYSTRGFVRLPAGRLAPTATSNERKMDAWAAQLVGELKSLGILNDSASPSAAAAAPSTTGFRLKTSPILYDDGKKFVDAFINRKTLRIQRRKLLIARSMGLISFYRGGSEELMPRVTRNDIVEVGFSDYAFDQYTVARKVELDMEEPSKPKEDGAAADGKDSKPKRKGMTSAEIDLYAQAVKTPQSGFLMQSRAACNWVWPEGVTRPSSTSIKDAIKLRGLDQDRVIAADLGADVDADLEEGAAALLAPSAPDAVAEAAAVIPDEAAAVAAEPSPEPAVVSQIGSIMAKLESESATHGYLNTTLPAYSVKYAEILGRIQASPGPALVYSQFKTLEGLGIFTAVLRAAQPAAFAPLDIVKGPDGEWMIPESSMVAGQPRYILYTGDQAFDKRRLLLQLYNADIANLPPRLSAQCATLLDGAPDNRDGRIARVFMITQSGAEGISLMNTRQVHLLEPYWNHVRIQQVIGRAIRLCSHMNLPWDDREVSIFTYLSVFTSEQIASGRSKEIIMADERKTTDQIIYDIAKNKQKLANGLFRIAQRAAIDCQLHFLEHGAATRCYKFKGAARPSFLHHPDIDRDVAQGAVGEGAGRDDESDEEEERAAAEEDGGVKEKGAPSAAGAGASAP
uniref:Helicase ATP-binding domain-containing protein n=1 Tax=viral metagenome TaxID=1070528 RepID=A0A6C0DB94_9ZZZZ